jgi:hypothetical protein
MLLTFPKTWKKRKFIQDRIKNDCFELGFNYGPLRTSKIPAGDYNLIGRIDLDHYEQIFEVGREHVSLLNIREQVPIDGELVKGKSKTDDPQIIIKLPSHAGEKLPVSFICIGLFMSEDECGQLIFFDKDNKFAISDNILLNAGYHDYILSIERLPLAPIGSPFSWKKNCGILRFDPGIRKNVMFAIKYIRIYVEK